MADADWKQRVRARYEALKKQGRAFFPYSIFKDTVAVFLIFLAVVALALQFGASLEEVADPTDTTYNPRPEWYFLFLFQALKFFPGALEPVAAIILPTLVILFLFALPFLDRGPKRHPLDRPLLTLSGLAAIAIFTVFTILGFLSPLLNPIEQRDPVVGAGKKLYRDLRCSYCHSIEGRGGVAAPDLSTVGARRDREWLTDHFANPQKSTPGSIMPRLHLLPEEITALVAYMQSLGGEGPFTPAAPTLFAEQCAACHALDGKGGDAGPDLTTVRSYRDKQYIDRYIRDPKTANRDATMPGFKGQLTEQQIEDLARYLSSAQR